MGYCIDVSIKDVVIPAANVAGACDVLRDLMAQVDQRGDGGTWSGGRRISAHFSWVNTKRVVECLEARSLVGALSEWRYASRLVQKDDLETLGDAFTGHQDVSVSYFIGEKLGQDEDLWTALAPFVQEGGIIEFTGEDNARWRYVFTGAGMKEQHGETVWKDA